MANSISFIIFELKLKFKEYLDHFHLSSKHKLALEHLKYIQT